MIFTFDISTSIAVLLVAALALTAIVALWQWSRARRLEQFASHDELARDYLTEDELPSVSVVVYAHNDADCLEQFLPLMLQQDYPCFEVIVVDDGSYDASRDIVSDMMPHFPNLRLSFSPDNTRSLSRKKLCLMLGIKAARNEVTVTTNANVRVPSDQWLRLMMRNFTPGTDVVLGYSRYRYSEDRSPGRFYRRYDVVTTALQWLTSAIKGKPYRGVSDNLAYRRHLFFEHNGFARNMDLRWGEDDVYVSEIAHGGNTRLELSPGSQVQVHYSHVPRAHRLLKLRRDFTTRQLSVSKPFLVQGLMSTLNSARLSCLTAAIALDWSNLFTLAVAAVLLVASWVLVTLPFNRACRVLHAPVLFVAVPLFAIWRPVVNLCYRVRGVRTRQANYTSIYD